MTITTGPSPAAPQPRQDFNCLIIAPTFFGYARAIQTALIARGLRARLFDDRPGADTVTKSLIRISPRLLRTRSDHYFDSITEEMAAHPIQEVLVIKGQALSAAAIRRMRAAMPQARFTLYFWDSYRNMSGDTRDKVPLFDRVLSFDPRDSSEDPRLQYRPLFYLDEYTNIPARDNDIDLLFVGTMHTDRYRVIKRVDGALPPGTTFHKSLYFVSPAVYWARRIVDPSYWSSSAAEFRFQPTPKEEIHSLLSRSRIVLDIERPIQSGLTIRTLEAMGAEKKLITTNPYIRETDLYRPENVLVIDRNSVSIPVDFLATDFQPLTPAIKARYSLAGWLSDVLPGYDANQGSPS